LEPEYFLLPPQNSTICRYPLPDQSSPFLPSHVLMIHLNINVPFTPRSSKRSLSLWFPPKNTASYQKINPSLVLCAVFRIMVTSYVEKLLASQTNPKLENHLLLAVCYCLFNTFAAALHIGGVFSSGTWGRAMSWWQGPLITDLQALQFQQTGVSGKFPGRMCASRYRQNAEEELQSTGLAFLWIKQQKCNLWEIIRPAKGRCKDTERENMAVKVFEMELITTILRREFWLW